MNTWMTNHYRSSEIAIIMFFLYSGLVQALRIIAMKLHVYVRGSHFCIIERLWGVGSKDVTVNGKSSQGW